MLTLVFLLVQMDSIELFLLTVVMSVINVTPDVELVMVPPSLLVLLVHLQMS
jgi:hypothetical protein